MDSTGNYDACHSSDVACNTKRLAVSLHKSVFICCFYICRKSVGFRNIFVLPLSIAVYYLEVIQAPNFSGTCHYGK